MIKLKFAFKKIQTLAVSGRIILHFKMNLIFVKTFLEESIYFTKKKKTFHKFTMAALGHHTGVGQLKKRNYSIKKSILG